MGKHLHGAFAAADPARFAALVQQSESVGEMLDVLLEIPGGLETDVLTRLSPESTDRILDQVSDPTLSDWLESGAAEDGRRILSKMAPERAAAVIKGIQSSVKRRELRRLTAYPQNSIGQLMQLGPILLSRDDTVAEIEASIRQHEGTLEGPIVVQNPDGTFSGVFDPVDFLKNAREGQTAVDFSEKIEPVFADSPANLLLADHWNGRNSLPVVNYERKPIGFVTRSVIESAVGQASPQSPLETGLTEVSRWYWTLLLEGLHFALSWRTER